MICSLNEVAGALRKAAVGSGYPPGPAADLAAATVWLCARRLDGVGAALASLASGYDADARWQEDDSDLRFTDAAVGRWGSSPFELLVAAETERVVVERPDSPLLLMGFAGTVARSTGAAFALSDGTDAPVVVTGAGAETDRVVPDRATTVHIEIARAVDHHDDHHHVDHGVAPDDVARGVEVSAEHWSAVIDLAARTYVPATNESRMSGAGAGLDDND